MLYSSGHPADAVPLCEYFSPCTTSRDSLSGLVETWRLSLPCCSQATTVVLSVLSKAENSDQSFVKVWIASVAASSSRQFM